jgi:hypothetical protein
VCVFMRVCNEMCVCVCCVCVCVCVFVCVCVVGVGVNCWRRNTIECQRVDPESCTLLYREEVKLYKRERETRH